jgi:hypothetical protein
MPRPPKIAPVRQSISFPRSLARVPNRAVMPTMMMLLVVALCAVSPRT